MEQLLWARTVQKLGCNFGALSGVGGRKRQANDQKAGRHEVLPQGKTGERSVARVVSGAGGGMRAREASPGGRGGRQ